ncbi:DMT family transporter [Archangium primigenium]|uniref:DMT family transporter n=1 Tax=[Archangium] primigenium TaxID=2792470 RepID=UPI00195EA004|nr:DMT family transporter [Archangium primigenium]MBM7114048.1 DMT family transporter [Archangium primigenium]
MQWLLIPFVILSGVLNSLQTGNNTQLGKSLEQPIAAAFIVYTVGILTLAVSAPFLGFSFSAYSRVGQAPWWAWLGGIFGAIYIIAMQYTTDRVGAGTFTGLTVTAALVTTVALDHFGWLGLKEHPATLWRLVGCALMIGGVTLVARH